MIAGIKCWFARRRPEDNCLKHQASLQGLSDVVHSLISLLQSLSILKAIFHEDLG